jgi:hypothetical protein
MYRSGLGPAAIAVVVLLGAVVAAGARTAAPREPLVPSPPFAHKPMATGQVPTDCRRCHDGRSLVGGAARQ